MTEPYQLSATETNPEENQLQALLRNKKLLLGLGGAVVIVGIVLVFMMQNSSTAPSPDGSLSPTSVPTTQNATSNFPSPVVQPTLTQEELQAAIQEQKNVDTSFAQEEQQVKAAYPWIYNLPLHTEKYFVYFDLDKKVFIGLLYPKAGDDVEQLKAEAMTQLKNVKNIPIENYTIEWTVNLQ